jgi:hypothetical protein
MSIYLDPSYFFKYAGDYVREYADVLPVCCSIDNYFVPLFAGLDGTYISHEAKKAIIYNLKDANSMTMDIPRTVSRFVLLMHQSKPRTILVRNTDELGLPVNVAYKTMKHFLYMNHNGVITPLYALCCGNKDIYTLDKNNPDYTKLFLLINPLLLTASHKVLAGRVKPLIKYFQELHVNIMYTENVGKLCLQETTFKNTFKTIDERMLFVRLVKQRVGLYVPPLPQSEVIPEPVIAPMEQVTEVIEVPEDQATGTIEWPDPTFVQNIRTSTTVTGTSIPHNLNHFGVSAPAGGWVTPTVEDWNAAAPQNTSQFGSAIIYGTGNPEPEYIGGVDPFDERPEGDEIDGEIHESFIANQQTAWTPPVRRSRRNPTRMGEGIRSQMSQFTMPDNGVADTTVISAATHERVHASFIDRSAFPVREVEFTIVDDLEEFMEQVAPLPTPIPEPVPEPVVTGPRPDPSILNDPSLLVSTSTNIAF